MGKEQLLSLASRLRARHLLVCLMFLLLGLPLTASAIDTVTINSQQDWKDFCEKYDNVEVNVLLNCDVTIDTKGFQMRVFKGTLDGQGHAFILNYKDNVFREQNKDYYDDDWDEDSAPFDYACGTIKNLRLTGTVAIRYGNSSYRENNPLVNRVIQGSLILENCHSNVAFVNTDRESVKGVNSALIGGFVGAVYQGPTVTFNNCSFAGSFTCNNQKAYKYYDTGGFIGEIAGSESPTVNINNCFSYVTYDDEVPVESFGYFVGSKSSSSNINTNNSYGYCVNKSGVSRTLANVEQCIDLTTMSANFMTSGEMAWKLNTEGDAADNKWVQTIGTDNVPHLRTFFPNSAEVYHSSGDTHPATTAKWITLYGPGNISTLPSGVRKFVVTSISGGNASLSELTYPDASVRPMVLYSKNGFSEFTMPDTYYNKTEQTSLLRGAYEERTAASGEYVLDAEGEKFVPATGTVSPWECYLVPGGTLSNYPLYISDTQVITDPDIIVIKSLDDWNDNARKNSGKEVNVKLACDLTLDEGHFTPWTNFIGTLDGQGHTVTFAYSEQWHALGEIGAHGVTGHYRDKPNNKTHCFMIECVPQNTTAVVKNLKFSGKLFAEKGNFSYVESSPIRKVKGSLSMENCLTDVNFWILHSSYYSYMYNHSYTGGFVSQVYSGGVATFTDCCSYVEFSADSYKGVGSLGGVGRYRSSNVLEDCGGYVGSIDGGGTVDLTNCYSYVANDISSHDDYGYFVGEDSWRSKVTTKNCYCRYEELEKGEETNNPGDATIAAEEDIRSGKVAYLLKAGRTGLDECRWVMDTEEGGMAPNPHLVTFQDKNNKDFEVFYKPKKVIPASKDKWATVFYPGKTSCPDSVQMLNVWRVVGDSCVVQSRAYKYITGGQRILYREKGIPQITLPECYYNACRWYNINGALRGHYQDDTPGDHEYVLNTATGVFEKATGTIPAYTVTLVGDTLTKDAYPLKDRKTFSVQINSHGDWIQFKESYNKNSVTAYLNCDLKLAGDEYMESFSGTFDGQGHTITGDSARAVFRGAAGTIKNLNFAGRFAYATSLTSAPIISSHGLTLENCHSSVDMCDIVYFAREGTDQKTMSPLLVSSGFVGSAGSDETHFKDCSFTGGGNAAPAAAAFLAQTIAGKSTYENCYSDMTRVQPYTPVSSSSSSSSSQFGMDYLQCLNKAKSVTNCYARTSSNSDIKNVSSVPLVGDDVLASGETTYKLNAGRTHGDVAWVQTLGTDSVPLLVVFNENSKEVLYNEASTIAADASKRWTTLFYPVSVTLPEGVVAYEEEDLEGDTLMVTFMSGDTVAPFTPAVLAGVGSGLPQIELPATGYYNQADADTTKCLRGVYWQMPATSEMRVPTTTADDGLEFATPADESSLQAWQCYLAANEYGKYKVKTSTDIHIRSKNQWDFFAKNYSNTPVDVWLDTDLTLTRDDAMMEKFKGTFDGQGHTITVDYVYASNAEEKTFHCAPFQNAVGTIKNLNLTGTITYNYYAMAKTAPLVSQVGGGDNGVDTLNIENCHSDVTFQTASGVSLVYAGGFIGNADKNAHTNFTDCSFTGAFKSASKTYFIGCFVGCAYTSKDKTKTSFNFTNCFSDASGSKSTGLEHDMSYLVSGYSGYEKEYPMTVTNCSAVKTDVGNYSFKDPSGLICLVDSAAAADGSQTYRLNAGRTGRDAKWMQTIGVDSVPQLVLFSESSLEVFQSTDTVKIGSAGWSTHYYPLAEVLPEGVKAYKVDGVTSNQDEYVVNLEEVTGTIPAYTPVLLCTLGEDQTEAEKAITINMSDYYYNKNSVRKDETLVEGFQLVGVDRDTETFEGCFVLQRQNNKTAFYRVDPEAGAPIVPAWKCMLFYNGESSEGSGDAGNAKTIHLRLDDEATAIKVVNAINGILGDGYVYDLQGRRVQTLQKGHVYIKNGQKFLVK